MMRKDVQIGFAIGGILVAVLIVYVLAVSGGKKNANGGAQLAEGPSSVEASPQPAPATTAPVTDPFKNTPSVASAEKPSTPAEKPQPSGTDEDKWVMALSKGTVPMMSSTPVAPAPTAPAGATTPASVKSAILNAAAPSAPALEAPASTDASAAVTGSADAASTSATQPNRPAAPASTPVGSRTHVVQAGETITKIAEAAYGSQNFFPHILRANPNVDPKKMRPGTVLVLPPESEVKAGLASTDKAEANPTSLMALHATATGALDPKTQYEVQPGDSLQKISTKLYGSMSKWEAIYELNKAAIGADPAKVKAKQVLKLPEPPTAK